MELVEIIMRIIYLVFLYTFLYLVMKYNTNLIGNTLQVISFFGAVLLLYATFPYVYKFLLNNELVFKLKLSPQNKEEEEENQDEQNNNKIHDSTSINNKLNISNERNEINSNVENHNHKFVIDKVFQQ